MHTATNHPTFIRCLAIAQAAGSTAKTPRGLARVLANNPTLRAKLATLPKPKSAAEYLASESRRKADPDAKRAIHDKAFRRRYLAGLRRREQRAITCDGSLSSVMEYYTPGAVEWRRAELRECARLRTIAIGKADSPKWVTIQSGRRRGKRVNENACEPLKAPSYGARVTIGIAAARKHGAPLTLRGKDACVSSCKAPSHLVHSPGETEWKNGKAVKYTRATNDNYVRSLAVIRDRQTIDYVCHETRYTVTLPEGFFWELDQHGDLRAVDASSPRDDFHPTADDLTRPDAGASIASTIARNRETRLRYAAQEAAEKAKIAGVYVCLADSLRAGNCKAGTLSFAQRHGLDPSRHYEAPELLAQANGDAGRVRLTITAAVIRHGRELERGYCDLAEHQAN